MAYLKYPCSSSPPAAATFTLESDDISTLLNSLLHNSSLPSTSPFAAPPPAPPPENAEIRRQFAGSAALSDSPTAAIGSLGFSFRGGGGGGGSGGCFYAPAAAEDSDRSGTVIPAAIPSSSAERFGDLDFDSERDQNPGYDALRQSALAATGERSSSKRSRAAEVHNMSEKRRRQKINEKLKALQKLIPNSNKTDKASMLDEAIEYLKQLQLQVQMLAMRNGSTLHPFYAAGGIHLGTSYNDGDGGGPTCTNQGIGTMLANGEMTFNNIYMPSNECNSSDQKIFIHKPITGTNNSERSLLLGIEPSTTPHCRPYMTNIPSAELCGDIKPPQLQLDMARCGTESASGISS